MLQRTPHVPCRQRVWPPHSKGEVWRRIRRPSPSNHRLRDAIQYEFRRLRTMSILHWAITHASCANGLSRHPMALYHLLRITLPMIGRDLLTPHDLIVGTIDFWKPTHKIRQRYSPSTISLTRTNTEVARSIMLGKFDAFSASSFNRISALSASNSVTLTYGLSIRFALRS